MQSVETIRHLFSYNEWANRRSIESLKSSAHLTQDAIGALAHLIIAEKTWLIRLLDNIDNTGFDFWPGSSIEESEVMAEETGRAYRDLVGRLTEDDLETLATYKNSKGIEYSTSYRDILIHVLMHSMYHRGQVARAVRAQGDKPAYTDYIAFVRETQN